MRRARRSSGRSEESGRGLQRGAKYWQETEKENMILEEARERER